MSTCKHESVTHAKSSHCRNYNTVEASTGSCKDSLAIQVLPFTIDTCVQGASSVLRSETGEVLLPGAQ